MYLQVKASEVISDKFSRNSTKSFTEVASMVRQFLAINTLQMMSHDNNTNENTDDVIPNTIPL